MRYVLQFLALSIFVAAIAACQTLAPPSSLATGKAKFEFLTPGGKTINVWTYRPVDAGPDSQILFIMHGNTRDADRYRDEWADLANTYGFIIVAPEFSNADYPRARSYNLGNVIGRDGTKNPKADWSFSVIEPLFDAVKVMTGTRQNEYSMYGHSAGSQFVHRFVYFIPNARVHRAISANAGWYTLPDMLQSYPYGLAGTPATKDDLKHALSQDLTILLGTQDIDPNSPKLRQTPEAMAQGAHRFARGHTMITSAQTFAPETNWKVQYVPGVGHDNRGMAPPSAKIFTTDTQAKSSYDILFLGDTDHADSYQERYEAQGKGNILKSKGYDYSLENFDSILNDANKVVVNLETVVTELKETPNAHKDYIHWTDPVKSAAAYQRHNFSAVSLANNHAMDYGRPGLKQTLDVLSAAGIDTFGAAMTETGARAPLLLHPESDGCRADLAVFGRFIYREDYDQDFDFYAKGNKGGTAALIENETKADVAELKSKDGQSYIVLFPHWGENYKWRTEEQAAMAKRLLGAGTDLILGQGAHTLGEVEQYSGGTVVHSIGNFMFNSGGRFYKAPDVLPMSVIAKLRLTPSDISNSQLDGELRLYPIYSDNKATNFQPRFVTPDEFARAANAVQEKVIGPVNLSGGKDQFGSYLSTTVKPLNCSR